MKIISEKISFTTRGRNHIIDLTGPVQKVLIAARVKQGQVTVFAVGSTAAVTTIEFEPGLVETDVAAMLEKLAPYGQIYEHNKTWGDDNGASHLRASLVGSSLTIPIVDGELVLGTWQQIAYIDFDTQPRSRTAVVQLMGE